MVLPASMSACARRSLTKSFFAKARACLMRPGNRHCSSRSIDGSSLNRAHAASASAAHRPQAAWISFARAIDAGSSSTVRASSSSVRNAS